MPRCSKCGKYVDGHRMKGCYKHPYCKTCFKEVWNNDEEKYREWLSRGHE